MSVILYDIPMKRPLYPLFLDLQDRPVLLVGAGQVATQKLTALQTAGAHVTVVAPDASESISSAAARGELRWHRRRFVDTDLDGVYLAMAATADPAVNAEVAQAAAVRRIFVNAVDDPQAATAYAAAQIVRGGVTIAISSGGRAPAVSRLLREALEQLLPSDEALTDWVAQASALRDDWKRQGLALGERYRDLLKRLLDGQSGISQAGSRAASSVASPTADRQEQAA